MKVLNRLGMALAIGRLLAIDPSTVAAQQQAVASAASLVAATTAADNRVSSTTTLTAANTETSVAHTGTTPEPNALIWTATPLQSVDSLHSLPVTGTLAGTAVALRMKHTTTNAVAPFPRQRTDSKALMIVGLAAVVTGIVVGDDAGTILILGGAGVGLYGLYKYMQ